jgi:hypothetical protein
MKARTPAKLGILMLDSHFPRVPGDAGNPQTWPFPVKIAVVPRATPQAVVLENNQHLLDAFIEAGRHLVAAGCAGIGTTCGFLTCMRPQLSRALGLPVAASALEQAAQIQQTLAPGRNVGILTISGSSLTTAHLRAAQVPEGVTVVGLEQSTFAQSILGNKTALDVAAARAEMVAAARHLVDLAPDTGAILLECTNMVPYAPDIQRETGLPVFSIYTYLCWFHSSLVPRDFPAP